MAVRALHGHGSPSLILLWLTGLYTVMALRASYRHGCQGFLLSRYQGFILSWLTGLFTVMAIRASYCYG